MTLARGNIRGGARMSNKRNRGLRVDSMPVDEFANTEPATVEEVTATIEPDVEEVTATIEPIIGVVKSIRLNVRETAFMKDNVIGELRLGDKVTVDLNESTDQWLRVHTESGLDGFCVRDLITLQQ